MKSDVLLEGTVSGWRLSTRKRGKGAEQAQWLCIGESRSLDAPLSVLRGLSQGRDTR